MTNWERSKCVLDMGNQEITAEVTKVAPGVSVQVVEDANEATFTLVSDRQQGDVEYTVVLSDEVRDLIEHFDEVPALEAMQILMDNGWQPSL